MATKVSSPLLPYEEKWVALTLDGKRVLASAKNVKALDKVLARLKVKRGGAVMTWVPRFDGWYAP